MQIGYIGLGNMGGPLAARLQSSHLLIVHDLNGDAVSRLVALGASATDSPAELAARCDLVLMCLPTSRQVEQVIFGENGVLAGARPGTLIVDQTTGEPAATRKMAARLADGPVELVDAPVSGGARGARAGTIAIMVGAGTAQFARILPVLEAISPNIFHAGGVGAGQVIKLANNLLHHSQRLLSLEILAAAVKNGIEPGLATDILLASSGRNYFLEHNLHPRILKGELNSGFTLDLLLKDVRLATEMGAEADVPMPISTLIREIYRTHAGDLGGDAEPNTVALRVDRVSGTRIVPAADTLPDAADSCPGQPEKTGRNQTEGQGAL